MPKKKSWRGRVDLSREATVAAVNNRKQTSLRTKVNIILQWLTWKDQAVFALPHLVSRIDRSFGRAMRECVCMHVFLTAPTASWTHSGGIRACPGGVWRNITSGFEELIFSQHRGLWRLQLAVILFHSALCLMGGGRNKVVTPNPSGTAHFAPSWRFQFGSTCAQELRAVHRV